MDSFYTPPPLANQLISYCRVQRPKRIVDFAAGDGALLEAALARWPDAEVTAMDLDEGAIENLASRIPHATLLRQDFFRFSDEDMTGIPRNRRDLFDVILLNPPFSCRGKTKFTACIDGRPIGGSRALAFVARALGYMHPNGELIAILPRSCLTSDRDAELRTALLEKCEFYPIGNSRSSVFRRCDVTVDVVRLTLRPTGRIVGSAVKTFAPKASRGRVLLMRGTVPKASGSIIRAGRQLVHTTDLADGTVADPTRWTTANGRTVSGSALLLPRVGRTKFGKIAIKSDPAPVVVSDCVVSLKTPDEPDEIALRQLIGEHWDSLGGLWTGSCAPYLTLNSLAVALEQFGYRSEQVVDMAVDCRTEGLSVEPFDIVGGSQRKLAA